MKENDPASLINTFVPSKNIQSCENEYDAISFTS